MSVNDLRIGILEGTITKDTELKHSETTHKPYVQFCIASNKSIKKNGNYEKDTVFFDLCLFGKMVEVYAGILKKGMEVRVEGEIRTKKDENNHKTLVFYVGKLRITSFPHKKEGEKNTTVESSTEEDFHIPGYTDVENEQEELIFPEEDEDPVYEDIF